MIRPREQLLDADPAPSTPAKAQPEGVLALEELGRGATPEAVAAIVLRHPDQRAEILEQARAHFGDYFVEDVVAELDRKEDALGEQQAPPQLPPPPPPPPGKQDEPDPAPYPIDDYDDPDPPQRSFRPTRHYPDLADAEAFNKGNVRNTVRFDLATGGRYAMMNGQLDAQCVRDWQAAKQKEGFDLEVDGKVDDATCDVAEGKAPKAKPKPAEKIVFITPTSGGVVGVAEEGSDLAVKIAVDEPDGGTIVGIATLELDDGTRAKSPFSSDEIPSKVSGAGLSMVIHVDGIGPRSEIKKAKLRVDVWGEHGHASRVEEVTVLFGGGERDRESENEVAVA